MSTAMTKKCDFLDEGHACGRPLRREGATTRVMIDGVPYEGELCHPHRKLLEDALAPFLEGMRHGQRPKVIKRATYVSPRGTFLTSDVREWAKKQGLAVPERGRLPEHLLDEYARKHNLGGRIEASA